MSLRGFVILFTCLVLGNAVRLPNYMKHKKTDDATTRQNDYMTTPVSDDSVSSTDGSLNTFEEDTKATYGEEKVKNNKNEEMTTQEPTTQGTEELIEDEENEESQPKKPDIQKEAEETETKETVTGESTTEKNEEEETSTAKPFIGTKCSFNKAQVEKTYSQWCDSFGKKNYPKLLKMYAKDGYIVVLSDTFHVHNPEDLKKLLAALGILETTFGVKKCEDFLASHESKGCDPKTKTASMNGIMKTVKFDPPITGSFKEVLIEEDGKLKILSQELDINDERK